MVSCSRLYCSYMFIFILVMIQREFLIYLLPGESYCLFAAPVPAPSVVKFQAAAPPETEDYQSPCRSPVSRMKPTKLVRPSTRSCNLHWKCYKTTALHGKFGSLRSLSCQAIRPYQCVGDITSSTSIFGFTQLFDICILDLGSLCDQVDWQAECK